MGHFAKVVNGQVTQVIVAEPSFFETFVDQTGPGEWIQTSYNTAGGIHYGPDGHPDDGIALRKNYAGIGYTYDRIRDAFIPPKVWTSWILNDDTCQWDPPIPYPNDRHLYVWNEETQQWDDFK